MVTRVLVLCGSLQSVSANRAAADVVASALRARGADVDDYDALAVLPPLDVDPARGPGAVVADWRARAAAADAVVVAAPEYAGALAGTAKNALDWLVGSAGVYSKPVAVVSAGTSGGEHARRDLVRTLTWQGGHVVAELGIAAPRTKSDAAGRLVHGATIEGLVALADTLLRAVSLPADDRLTLVRPNVMAAGVDIAHIAPVV
jgi:chromate reductase, NAD(P)H dehydrogenase (quinone)